jgi:hypothetical protein
MAVGGQDVICVKQKHSSKVPPGDLRRHLEDLGDFLFSDLRSPSLLERKTTTTEAKQKVCIELYFTFLHNIMLKELKDPSFRP